MVDIPGTGAADWLRRLATGSVREPETDGWVGRLLVNETGELTSTAEYVYRYGVVERTREGELEPATAGPGGWSPDRERAVVTDEDAAVVTRTLARLERRGLLERVAPGEPGDPERTYWRLTDAGERERERLERGYRRELEQLQLEFGMTTDW